MRLRRMRLAGCVLVVVALVALVGAGPASARPDHTVPLITTSPPLPDGTIDNGPAPAGARLEMRVVLSVNNEKAAERQAQAVSDPKSRDYGHYLSPGQYRRLFSPTRAQISAVEAWATSQGLVAGDPPANRTWIPLTGTVAQANRTFRVVVHDFEVPAGDGTFLPLRQPSTPARLLRELDGLVIGISGLSTTAPLSSPDRVRGDGRRADAVPKLRSVNIAAPKAGPGAPPSPSFVVGQPCSQFWGEKTTTDLPPALGQTTLPFAPCGYTPAQLQGAYAVDAVHAKGITGSGVTVAVTDAYNSPTILDDANTFATRHGQPAFAAGQFREIHPAGFRLGFDDTTANGDVCGEQGWYGEETLDVEAVHTMAPGANVLFVGGSSCEDFDLLQAVTSVVDGHLAQIITNSWGDVGELDPVFQADEVAAYNQLFVQAALEGIGVFFSSGDSGDESVNLGTPSPDDPASNPWVTAVGGTALGVGAHNDYLFETAWGTGRSLLSDAGDAWVPDPPGPFTSGSGGGISADFAEPFYQKKAVPRSLSDGKHRVVPDVALLAEPSTGMLVGQTQTFLDGSEKFGEYRIGGTSVASPLMAGVEALADQAAGRAHGFVNPAVYEKADTGLFRDTVQPAVPLGTARVDNANGENPDDGLVFSFRAFNITLSLPAAPGYDDVTGFGTPFGSAYVFGI
jgi:subtilase family serine protease